MNFLKNFFNDESVIVGLCSFNTMNPKYSENPIEKDFFFNPFESKTTYHYSFETNFQNNILL
jgi:hypothetical protein